jgi:hypothetical protein
MNRMKVLGHTQYQTVNDPQIVPVLFYQSINTVSNDHMMCSLYYNPHPASFCLGASGGTDPESARMIDLDA